MRLLNALTQELELFPDPVSNDVPYAILSHTWMDDEVTFEDMKDVPVAQTKVGFAKIRAACDKATEFGLHYIWVDTCCIDKSSSAELSEAINSMYRWYKNSTICFAFLADLPSKGSPVQSVPSSMRGCRWFTRGWTLQELIAPPNFMFVDEDWKDVGTKVDLSGEIEAITGISRWVLDGSQSLASIPLAKRMSWAAARQTTRVEDKAYCLLGIFGVNMPMIYGEGCAAFIRLQQAILSMTTDLSLFAWEAFDSQSDSCRGILAESPAEFLNCGSIELSNDQFQFRDEISLTNRGIKIQAALTHIESCTFVMDLHCYATTPLGQLKRLGIYLKQAQDVYFRLRSHETTTAELASRSPLPRPIYLATIVDESIEVPRGVFGNNENRIISIKLPMDTPSYSVHSIKAVPELYWQRHLGCFSIGRLSNFTCFVRFAVTSRVAPHERHYKNTGEETTSLILVCDLADASNFQMSLYAQTGLQNSVKPPRFIDPFTRIDDYGPLGDPFSLLILRPDGIEERRVKMMHQDQGLNYVVSATLDSSQKSVFIAKIAVSPPMGEAPARPHPLMQGRQQIGEYRPPAQMIYQLPREALSVAPPRNDAYAEPNGYRHGNVPVFPLGAYAYEEPDDYHFRELASVAPPQNYQRNEATNYPRRGAASVATPTNYALIPREQREREMPSVAPPQDDGFRDHPWK